VQAEMREIVPQLRIVLQAGLDIVDSRSYVLEAKQGCHRQYEKNAGFLLRTGVGGPGR